MKLQEKSELSKEATDKVQDHSAPIGKDLHKKSTAIGEESKPTSTQGTAYTICPFLRFFKPIVDFIGAMSEQGSTADTNPYMNP